MVFVRDVGADKMREAWDESFEKNCAEAAEGADPLSKNVAEGADPLGKKSCDALKPQLQKLQSLVVDLKNGDVMAYTLSPSGVEVSVNGKSRGKVASPELAKLVLSTWIGKHPPNDELKEGMLGLSKGE